MERKYDSQFKVVFEAIRQLMAHGPAIDQETKNHAIFLGASPGFISKRSRPDIQEKLSGKFYGIDINWENMH